MRVVCNSSPLIYLAKAGLLKLLERLFKRVLIPPAVYKEVVVKGIREKLPDAVVVRNAVGENWVRVAPAKPLAKLLQITHELEAGETQAIFLAKKTRAQLLLVDDASARRIAESYGLRVRGTLYVVLLALKKGFLSKAQAKHALKKIVSSGFRLSPELYSRVLEEIENG